MNDRLDLLRRACDELTPAVLSLGSDEPRRATFVSELRSRGQAWQVRVEPLPGPECRATRAVLDVRIDGRDLCIAIGQVEPAAEGGAWLTLASAPQDRPQRSHRIFATAETVVATFVPEALGLGRCHLPVLDIGTHGLRLASSVFMPTGTVLRDLVVVRHGQVLRRAEGVVAGCTPILQPSGRPSYWCSVRLRAASSAPREDDPADDIDVQDAERVRAVLWALCDLGRPVTLRWGGRPLRGHLLPVKGSRSELPAMRCRLEAATLVRAATVTIESSLFGSGFRFMARVDGEDGGVVSLRPEGSIREWHRRREERVSLADLAGATIAYRHPLSGLDEVRPLVDLSSHGIGFADVAAEHALWPGLPLEGIRIEVPGLAPLALDASVRSVAGGRCGLELDHLPDSTAELLRVEMIRLSGQPIELHDGADLDELVQFHTRIGLLEPAMMQNLQATMDETRDGWRRAHRHPDGLVRTAVGRWKGQIGATHNLVRAYEAGWMFQHSASESAAVPAHQGMLQAALIGLALPRPDGEFFCAFVNDEAKSHHAGLAAFFATSTPEHRGSTRFNLYAAPALPADPAAIDGERLRRLEGADEALVERAALRLLDPVCVGGLALRAGQIGLPKSRAAFARVGLERGREAVGAFRNGRYVATMVREWASPGLSLSSLLSAGMLLPVRPDEDPDGAARRALCEQLRRAPTPGNLPVRFMFMPDGCDDAPVRAAGFERARSCVLYAWHRFGIREYYRYVTTRYGAVHGRLRARVEHVAAA